MLRVIRDVILFITIFSFFNDNLMVDISGSLALKAVFILFVLVNLFDIFKATMQPATNAVIKSYNIFITIFSLVTLVSVIFLGLLDLFDGLLIMVGIHVVFVYFSYYREFDKLLYFIWASVFISAFSSLFHEPIAEFTYRITGGTADPVEFSAHLFMGSFITIFLFNKNRNYIFLIGSILLFLYAMLYAGSKTAILTIAVLALYTLIVRFSYVLRRIFSLRGLVSIAIVLFVVFQSGLLEKLDAIEGMKQRTATVGETMRTAETRFAAWEAGYGMIEDYLFTGVGVNQFPNHAVKYLKVSFNDVGLLNPHNILVKMFSEVGVFAFLSFIVFLFFLIKTRYFELLKSEYFWISLIPISSLIMGMALNTTYDKHLWLSFALWSNVILMYGMHYKEERA